MTFAPTATPCQWFWSTGAAWGTVLQASDANGEKSVRIDVLDGRVRVDRVQVGDTAFQPEPSGELSRGSYQLSRRTSGLGPRNQPSNNCAAPSASAGTMCSKPAARLSSAVSWPLRKRPYIASQNTAAFHSANASNQGRGSTSRPLRST